MAGKHVDDRSLCHESSGTGREDPSRDWKRDPGIVFSRNPLGLVLAVLMLLFFLNLFLALATLLMGPFLVFHELGGEEFVFLYGFTTIDGRSQAVYYLILTTIITLSFYKALREDGTEFLGLLGKEIASTPSSDFASLERPGKYWYDDLGTRHPNTPSLFSPYLNNTLVLVALLFFSIHAFNIVFDFLVSDLLGITRHVQTSIADIPTWRGLAELPEASVVEEVWFRVLLIGVPLYLIHKFEERRKEAGPGGRIPAANSSHTGRRSYVPSGPGEDIELGLWDLVRSLFKKENRKYLLGGEFPFTTKTVLLLLVSSALVSMLHVGWSTTELFPSFLGSMALGALFLRKGLHASILLHFALNSFTIPTLMAGEPVVLALLSTILYYGLLVFGLYYLCAYLGFFRNILEEVEPSFRNPEFSRAIVASAGVILLFFSFAGAYYAGTFLQNELVENDNYEELTKEHYLPLAAGEFHIIELSDFEIGDSCNGSLRVTREEASLELLAAHEYLKDRWVNTGGEVGPEKFLFYIHLSPDPGNQGQVGERTFSFELDDAEHVFFIIRAKNESRCYFTYTIRTTDVGLADAVGASVCGLFIGIVGLGCLATSSYYRFSNNVNSKQEQASRDGIQDLNEHPRGYDHFVSSSEGDVHESGHDREDEDRVQGGRGS